MRLNKVDEPLPKEFKKTSIRQDLRNIKIWVGVSGIIIGTLYIIAKSTNLF